MEKQTSARVSSIASRILKMEPETKTFPLQTDYNSLLHDAKTLAASALGQDEHAGQQAETFVDRLHREYRELDERTRKLQDFVDKGMPGVNDDQQKDLLECQLETMRVYRSILNMRLNKLPHYGSLRAVASESEPEPGQPREIGGHDHIRDGDPPFGG